MLKGTVIENSLQDVGILNTLTIIKSWTEGDWKLHQIVVSRNEAINLGKCLSDGPWYMHFWEEGNDMILVVFKNAYFDIAKSDKTTWAPAIEYGRTLSIPEEQLDFLTE